MQASNNKATKRGRPPGAKNKVSEEIRKSFNLLIEDNIPNLSIWLAEVAQSDPKAALEIVIKMSEFVLPKLSRVQQEVDETKIITPVIDLSKWR
jgi:hypothetical protein